MTLFQPSLLLHYLLNGQFFSAAMTTLWLSVASLATGVCVGLLLAVGQEASARPVRLLVLAYIWLFRGTPVLLQLVFAFNVLPAFGIVLPGSACAILALGLNEGAYMAEIMRSGIRAVGRGQRQAARALGMEERQIMRWVVLPQALRIVIPPLGNEFTLMVKGTSLLSIIGVREFFGTLQDINSATFRTFELFLFAAAWYLILTTILGFGQKWLERRMARHEAIAAQATAAALSKRALLGGQR